MPNVIIKNTNDFPLTAYQAHNNLSSPLTDIAPGEEVELTIEEGATLAIKAKEEEAGDEGDKQAA